MLFSNCIKQLFILIVVTISYGSSSEVQTRIVGGKPVRLGQIPYQAFLYLLTEVGGSIGYPCSGTLISNQFILTAAHCLCLPGTNDFGAALKVYLGIINVRKPNEKALVMDVNQNGFIKHNDYTPMPILNDIALVKLPKIVEFNDFIRPAVLPQLDQDSLIEQKVISSGWGRTDDIGTFPTILQYMKTLVVSGSNCEMYGDGRFFEKKQICINAQGKSVCNGDSGGPHVIKKNEKNIIVGITSFGASIGCTIGAPQVLTRVSYYLKWIHNNTKIPI